MVMLSLWSASPFSHSGNSCFDRSTFSKLGNRPNSPGKMDQRKIISGNDTGRADHRRCGHSSRSPQNTLRQRMEIRTGDNYCWRCHQKMDPLGFPFESYDDFGRFRIQENLEHPDNLVKEARRDEIWSVRIVKRISPLPLSLVRV